MFTLSFYFPLMPNACSAPGCTSNYYPVARVHIFRIPDNWPELKQAWIRALHSEDIDRLKVVNVCIKCFLEEYVGYFHKVPSGDGTFNVPRDKLNFKDRSVPFTSWLSLLLFINLTSQTYSPVLCIERRRIFESNHSV